MTSNPVEIPFGRFSLSSWREGLRRLAGHLPRNGLGRRMRSVTRRLATVGIREPYDIEVFPEVRARIYPNSNVCEKRVFAAPQLYDWPERHALSAAIADSTATPFIFVDLGANVGVYTLWMISEARRLGRPLKALAVEPDPETFGRLTTNLALSAADEASALQCAVGAREMRGHVVGHADNRGQHRVTTEPVQEGAESVAVLPLHSICVQHGLDRIDAMKVDLEGVDDDVLSAFFAAAPQGLWPRWLVVEVGKQSDAPVIDRCRQHDYRLHERTKLNAIFCKRETDRDTG